MIRAVLFDMDGLLIDSEPLWTIAEIEGFGSVGLRLDEAQCARTVGMGLEDVVALRYAQQPWQGVSLAEVGERVHRRVIELIRERGLARPGACRAVEFARGHGVKLGLATASDGEIIEAVLQRLDLVGAFDAVQSADELSHGKPHPAVFLVCARRLGVEARDCLVLEDSIQGLIAAKAARMRALAVPDPRLRADPRLAIADVVIPSLEQFDEALWQRLESILA